MIPDKFVKYGEQFTLVSIIGPYRVYRRNRTETKYHYEVMKPINMKGVMILPGASMWGIYGWSCNDEVAVVKRIQQLIERDKTEFDQQTIRLMTNVSDADSVVQCADASAQH
jgi:hypothetical protein